LPEATALVAWPMLSRRSSIEVMAREEEDDMFLIEENAGDPMMCSTLIDCQCVLSGGDGYDGGRGVVKDDEC
jgi:hypothetical protein